MEDIRTDIRNDKGQWLAPPPGSEKTRITTANARTMVQKRWEKYRQQAVKRITDEARSVDMTVSTGADAFGLVAAKQFAALLDSDKPRIADLEKLGHIMTGMDNSQRENASDPSNAILASPSALVELLDMIEARQRDAVDRARAVDADSTPIRSGEV